MLDNLRDRRQNRNELRKNHLSDIKSDVLQPLLEKLVQIETMIHENMYSRLNEPKDFSELSPPVKSSLYEALGAHFPETVRAWNEYHSDLVNWARKCQKLYNSLKSSVETEAKVKLPCECGLAWHDFLDPLVHVVYFDLFAYHGDPDKDIEHMKIQHGNEGSMPMVETDFGSAGIPNDDVSKLEAAKTALRQTVKEYSEEVALIKSDREKLLKSKNATEAAIRKALATLRLSGVCQYCK